MPDGPPRFTPRLLLFDLDDTLCDYAAARDGRLRTAFRRAFDAAALPTGARPDLDGLVAASLAVHPHGADHFHDLLGRHGVGADEAAIAQRWYRDNRFAGLRLFAGAAATLRRLRQATPERGIGIVTNGPAEVQRAKIELLEVLDLADFAVVSGEFGVEKPEPAIFREALRLGGAAPADALYVGDDPGYDVAGAHAAGIPVVWMNRRRVAWSWPIAPAAAEIHDVRDLLPLLGVADGPDGT